MAIDTNQEKEFGQPKLYLWWFLDEFFKKLSEGPCFGRMSPAGKQFFQNNVACMRSFILRNGAVKFNSFDPTILQYETRCDIVI